MLLTLVTFIATILFIVTIHEFGHFLAARLTGMRVRRFSIGFPPKIFSWRRGDTEYSLSWIPLGGYVQIAGMVDESMDDEGITGAPDEFMSKNPAQKVFVLSAGVIMNYLTAFLIIAVLTLVVGVGEVKGTRVGEVIADMPALTSGVRAGDQIVAVNGTDTPSWEAVVKAISLAGDTIALTVERADTARLTFAIPTKMAGEGEAKRKVIGIAPEVVYRAAGPGDALDRGWRFCAGTTTGIIGFLKGLGTGESSVSAARGTARRRAALRRERPPGRGVVLFLHRLHQRVDCISEYPAVSRAGWRPHLVCGDRSDYPPADSHADQALRAAGGDGAADFTRAVCLLPRYREDVH